MYILQIHLTVKWHLSAKEISYQPYVYPGLDWRQPQGLLEFTCLCPDLIVVTLVINWKSICQTTILMGFFCIDGLETKHHSYASFKITIPNNKFRIFRYGLKTSMWESFIAVKMQYQLICDGGLQKRHHKRGIFNCKGLRSSLYDVKSFCETHYLVFLQETWLMPHNTSILHSIHDSFYGDGVLAVNTENGILVGRPYGGEAILWRKSSNMCVEIIKDKNVSRIMGIVIKREVTPHTTSWMYISLLNLQITCHENGYVLGDQSKLPGQTFTFHSDAHDTLSWLDHALCSVSMYQLIDHMSVLYQYLTSDHFPLSLYLNVPYTAVPKLASDDVQMSTVLQKVDWGQLPVETVSNYMHTTDVLLRDLVLPDDVIFCSVAHCTNQGHMNMLSNNYGHIVNCLQKADEICIPKKHTKKLFTPEPYNESKAYIF